MTSEKRTIIYIDESGFANDMPRNSGYSLKGKRCYAKRNWGAKGRINAIGAMMGKALLTVSLFTCNVNSDVFTAWIQQDLIDKLPANSILVLDNASFHKGTELEQIVTQNNHQLLYLPPYSPDLNPIEHIWAKTKAIRRQKQCSVQALFADPNHYHFIQA